jgi:hypothetical protein
MDLPYLNEEIVEVTCYPIEKEEFGVLNTYDADKDITPIPCDLAKFEEEELTVFKEVLADNDDAAWHYILSWIADTHQRPSKKIPNSLFFQGSQGNGKSSLINYLYVKPHGVFGMNTSKQSAILGKFNARIGDKFHIFMDEISRTLNFEKNGDLKYFITQEEVDMEAKGRDSNSIKSFHQLVFASNNLNVVVLNEHDRRLSYFKVSDKYMQNAKFWEQQWKKMKAPDFVGKMKYFLLNYQYEPETIIYPFENAQRKMRVNKPNSLAEDFFLNLLLTGSYGDNDMQENVTSIVLNMDKETLVPMHDVIEALAHYVRKQMTRFNTEEDYRVYTLQRYMSRYTNMKDVSDSKKYLDDKGRVTFPPRREILEKLALDGVIDETERFSFSFKKDNVLLGFGS